MPWPLVHPCASRAPNIMSMPPAKPLPAVSPRSSPKRQFHKGGTLRSARSPESRELTQAPSNRPITSIHSQSILGGLPSAAFFSKVGIGARSRRRGGLFRERRRVLEGGRHSDGMVRRREGNPAQHTDSCTHHVRRPRFLGEWIVHGGFVRLSIQIGTGGWRGRTKMEISANDLHFESINSSMTHVTSITRRCFTSHSHPLQLHRPAHLPHRTLLSPESYKANRRMPPDVWLHSNTNNHCHEYFINDYIIHQKPVGTGEDRLRVTVDSRNSAAGAVAFLSAQGPLALRLAN